MPPDTGKILTDLHEAVRTEQNLEPRLQKAREDKRRLLLEARAAGIPVSLLASVLGVSEARVYALVEQGMERGSLPPGLEAKLIELKRSPKSGQDEKIPGSSRSVRTEAPRKRSPKKT